MSYIYDQRKRPQGRENTAPEHAAAPGPDFNALMTGQARPTAAQKGQPFDLDAAVKAKMENAFGDLSNLKFYKSRAVGDAGAEAMAMGNEIAFAPGMADFSSREGQERLGHELSHVMSQRSGAVRGAGFLASASLEAQADREGAMAAAGGQVYTGPVNHALSAASPSPMAAGPMQAKRGGSKKAKPKKSKKAAAPEPILSSESRSEHADDFDLLNSQQGSDEERRNAYNRMALPTAQRMTPDQKQSVVEYIKGSQGPNAYLRGMKNDLFHPKTEEEIQNAQKEVDDISQVIQNSPLPENLTTYRGTTDKFFAYLLQQNGLGDAVKNGKVDHKWLNKHQKKLRKNLVGKLFHEKAFTSTSTEKSFAHKWSIDSSFNEKNLEYGLAGETDKALALQELHWHHPEKISGAHLMKMNLPKGSKGAFIDRATDNTEKPVEQREVLLDKGSMFKISDIRKMKDSDSYELVMDLLAEEEGKKK